MHIKRFNSGFTLIEMFIVIAIISILAAIAIPAYNNYINRGKIKTVQADLTALSLNFENQYQRMLSYPTGAYANTGLITTAFKGWSPASATTDFSFSTADATAATYTIIATGTSGGIKDCKIQLKHDGSKSISTCSYSASGKWL